MRLKRERRLVKIFVRRNRQYIADEPRSRPQPGCARLLRASDMMRAPHRAILFGATVTSSFSRGSRRRSRPRVRAVSYQPCHEDTNTRRTSFFLLCDFVSSWHRLEADSW